MRTRLVFRTLAAGILAGHASATAAEETVIELGEVPTEVMEAAEEHFADLRLAKDVAGPVDDGSVIDDNIVMVYEELGPVTVTGANTETEDDGSLVYEIQGTVGDGRKVEIDLEPDGTVLEIEIEFEMDDVPGAVRKALAEELPDFAPEFIEASHSAGMQVMAYEFVGTSGGETMDIEVSADGSRIVAGDQ